MTKTLHALVASAAFLLTMSAQATALINDTGLSGSVTHENFDVNAGENTVAASQFSNVTFGDGNYISNDYAGAFPHMTGSVIANFQPCCTAVTSFKFDSLMSDVAFAFVTNPGTTVFSAYQGNTLVETFTSATDYAGSYFGFENIVFDTVRIDSTDTVNAAYVLDDLQYRAAEVPEPASLALVGLGLVGALVARRRQRG